MRLAVVSGLLMLGFVGCISDDNAATSEDAGAPDFDSGPVLDRDSGPLPDVTVPDATTTPDATTPPPEAAAPDVQADTTPPAVQITVLDPNRVPEPGITLVFSDPAGALVGSATTTSTGTVIQQLAADSMVTAIFGTPQNPALVTVVGVQPGDVLTAVDTSSQVSTNLEIDSLPPNQPDAGTGVEYELTPGSGCGGSGFSTPPVGVTVYPRCSAGDKATLLLTIDSTTPQIFSGQKGISLLPDAGEIALTGAWGTATTQTISASNFPVAGTGWVVFNEIAGGVPFTAGSFADFSNPDAGALETGFTYHPGFADFVQGEATIATFASGESSSAIATRSAPFTDGGTIALDMSQLLPLLTSASTDSTNPARPLVSWGVDGGAVAGADGALVAITWFTDGQTGTWTFVVPPTATSVQAPIMPDSVSALVPDPEAGVVNWQNGPTVDVIEGTFISGYAQLRATFASVPATSLSVTETQPTIPPLPVDGTLRLTEYTFNGD